MKRVISLLLVVVLAFSICACSKKDSDSTINDKTETKTVKKEKIKVEETGITLSDFEQLMQGHDPSYKFSTEEVYEGIEFEYSDDTENMEMEYGGMADSEGNIHSMQITHFDISKSIITDREFMEEMINSDSGSDYTTEELKTMFIFYNVAYLFVALGYSPDNTDEIYGIICDGETFEVDGWSISAAQKNSNFVISAEYTGK